VLTSLKSQAQLEDTARIRSQIDEGLTKLRTNMSVAMAGLKSSTDALIKSKASELDLSRHNVRADMKRRETALQTQLTAAEKEEAQESAAHQQQILELKAKELQKASQLRSSLSDVEAAERLANQKLSLRQLADATAGRQRIASMNAKLTRAVTEVGRCCW
jgi:hypothetical protein